MKRILIFAAAALALFSCQDKPAGQTGKTDKVEISAESKTIDSKGGSFSVIVSSSADWTLTSAEDYGWVNPSATTGQDGDVVKFTVEPNGTGNDLEAKYSFVTGEAKADLTIKSLAGDLIYMDVDIKDAVLDHYSGELTLKVSSSVSYRELRQSISAGADWLKYVVTLPGDDANSADMVFSYEALDGLDDRSAVITISAEGLQDVDVNVLQEAEHVLYTDKSFYTLAVEGETAVIPVVANVEYEIAIEQEGNWLTAGTKTAEGVPFTATALTGDKRSAKVIFTQTDAEDGEEPLVMEIMITQVNTLISWAADLRGNRLFPKWEGTAGKLGVANAITLEAMINVEEFHSEISTIMGIEGRFLLRFGDAGVPINRMQVATLNGNYLVDYEFQTNTWYHIACTYEMTENYLATVKIYVDGVLVGEKAEWSMSVYIGWPTYGTVSGVDFSPVWNYEPDGTRVFWYGYSYDANRDLRGKMTEIRIWNKVLTAEEINAENHFYTVDPQSEGLHSYWKFQEGSGNTVADATGNGNVLYGETDVRKQGSDNIGDDGIVWVEVALPDK